MLQAVTENTGRTSLAQLFHVHAIKIDNNVLSIVHL